ncbi:MAG: ATP-binding protein [Chloroflexota bacterium]
MIRRSFSIRRDLSIQLLALYLLLIVPFLITLLVFDNLIGQRIQADVRATDLALARAIAQETNLSISRSLQAVESMAHYPGVMEADIAEMEALFSVILNTRADVNLVYRLDADGIMVYHYPTGPGSTVGTDFSFREYYQRALDSGGPLVSEGRISPTTEQPVATALMPLHSADGRFEGLVATNIKLESLSDTLAQIAAEHRPDEFFEVVIVDSSAHVIAHPDPDFLLLEAGSLLPDVYQPALSGKVDSEILDSPTGQQRLYTYAPITSAGWGVVVSRPTAAAFATQITVHNITLIVVATFMGIGLFFWIALASRIITPIEQLAATSQAIGAQEAISPADRERLNRLSQRPDQVGHLIRSILKMEKSIEARINEQAILLETSTAMVSSLDSQVVLNRILEQVQKLLGVEMCAIVALDEQGGIFRARASRGLSKRYAEQFAIQPSESQSATMRAIRSREPIQISDTETDPTFTALRPRSRAEGYRSLLAVPLNTQHAPPSVLLVYRPDPHVFTPNETGLLVTFANHAAMAIENATLFSRSDMRLQEQTRRLEALVQSLVEGLILGNLNGRVVYANRRVIELASLPPEDLTTTPVERVLNRIIAKSADPPQVRKQVDAALKSKGQTAEIPISSFGRMKYLRLQAFNVTDTRGISIGQGIILYDITADRELDRMKSSLISTVSHELRTPLAAIKGYASTLLADDVEWDKVSEREFLSVISSEADRLSSLVNNLLDLSRIEAGSLQLSLIECSIGEMVNQAAHNAPLSAGNRFRVELEPGLPVLYADPPRLETVLRNLIQNAVKYAGPEAEIRVNISRKDDFLIFRVQDNGPGIPIEESSRVFDSFYRLDNGLRRITSGAGLGLAICQGLVRAHGGEIWVEPQEVGTCLAFSIPVRNAANEPEEQEAEA